MTFYQDPVNLEILGRLLVALGVGAAVGMERTHHGRPAGFRTHALVALSSCLLMLVTVYESRWFPEISQARVTLDPTRMAQGIMTGIGFLGAGAILREGFTVRGLTTAASLWTTSAIGVLVGIGFTFPALVGTILTLATLGVFRWIEDRIPTPYFARVVLRFKRADAPSEKVLRGLLAAEGFAVASAAYRVDSREDTFEFRIVVRSASTAADQLAVRLGQLPAVREFRVAPFAD